MKGKHRTVLPRLTLTWRIIALFTIVSLLIFSVSAIITYRLHMAISEKEISRQFTQSVEQVAARIDLRLQDVYRLSDQIVFSSQVNRYLEASGSKRASDTVNSADLNASLNQLLYSLPNLVSIYVYDLEGNYYMPSGSLLPYESGAIMHLQMEEMLKQSDGELVWKRGSPHGLKVSYQMYESRGQVITAARWMKNDQAEIFGVLVLVMNDSILANELNNAISGNDGRVFLLDRSGNLLYTDEQEADETSLSMLSHISGGEIRQAGGQDFLFAKARTGQTRFELISRISMTEIQRKSQIIPQVTLISALISSILGGLLVGLAIHRLLLPLKELVRGMRWVQNGNLHARIKVRTRDELAYIGKSFNSMLDHIDELIKEGYEKQLREREAELTALQAQLNPHFLYNTLDMIHSRLYLQDDKKTANLVINLSDLLRYALEPATTQTTVKAELEQLDNYLKLQKARFEEGLHIEVNAADEVLECHIIRLLLQPLVENVFVHAFRDTVGLKKLELYAYRDEDYLVIEIRDNGCGLPPEKLREAELPVSSFMMPPNTEKRARVGLRNAIRRIGLFYGPPYRMEATGETDGGTTIFLYLPYHRQDKQLDDQGRNIS